MKPEDFMIVEGVEGYFYYHISPKDRYTHPLCDNKKLTMYTAIPLEAWGTVTHIRERYCDKCQQLYEEIIKMENV